MERIATIVLLIATVAGFYYGYVDSIENQEAENRTTRFTIPHDSDASTTSIVVSLDGSGSSDENGDPIEYKWSVNPSSTDITSNDTELTSFKAEPGEYTFTLTITDSYNVSTTAEHIVVVEEEPNDDPEASIIAVLGDEDDSEPEEVVLEVDTTAVDSLAAEMPELEEEADSDSTTTAE